MPSFLSSVLDRMALARFRRVLGAALLAAGVSLLGPLTRLGGAAHAHPHVSVVASMTINIDKGAITGISHVWVFDDLYSAMAVDGLPKNKAGGYGREELAELAKVNIDGLKEFGYFTLASLDKTVLKVGDPKPGDYWLEHKDGVLSLHFTVPLEKPVLIDAKGFTVAVTDPSYFIAFEMASKDPARLSAGAPKSCSVTVGPVKEETAEEKKLSGVFAEQMSASAGFGAGLTVASVRCAP